MKVNVQSQMYTPVNPQDVQLSQNQQLQNLNFGSIQNDFGSILKNTEVVAKQTAFETLMDRLNKQEKAVFNNPSISNINAYKSIVIDILKLGSSNFNTNEMELYSNAGYRKLVNASEVIDKELQSILNDFLESNRLSMSMVDSFANIKGLLLEIFI